FEDYIYRIWIQQADLASAHVDAAQNHIKNNYMRNPLAAEVFNEEVANLLKRKIKDSLSKIDDLTIHFDYRGEVTSKDSEEILAKVSTTHRRFLQAAKKSKNEERRRTLELFAVNLEKAFYGF